MPLYAVTYDVYVEVEANNEDEAIDMAIALWGETPDGQWEAKEI